MATRLDIVLFGASGFTGTYCVESLHNLTKANGRSLTWGIAGRSETKLKEVLQEYQTKIGQDLSSIPIIIADVNDYESLTKMTASAKILINACGPYRMYGEPVIKACIETGTHQVDITGEPQYMETIQLKYHKEAQEKGVYIVSACGFDSIPADLGILFLQNKFEGTLNSVEAYLELVGCGSVNFATYECVVHGIGSAKELGALRRKLYPTPLPKFQPKLEPRPSMHKSELVDKWSVPFLGSDRSVATRTQRYLFDNRRVRPAQVQMYLALASVKYLVLMVIMGSIFAFLAKYKFGRDLLLNYPAIFTAGLVKHGNPSKEEMESGEFIMTMKGSGWNEKLSDVSDEFKTSPDKNVMIRVSGKNPGYRLCANLVTLAAIVVLTEIQKLPKGGGVYTPGAAFVDTSLTGLAQENGLKIEVL